MNTTLALRIPVVHRVETDEAALLARCRAGERAAFETLLARHRERILNLAFQMLGTRDDAEDVAQEAFTRAFSRIHTFRGDAALATWLYRITLNLCHGRRRRARPTAPLDEEYSEHSNSGVETRAVTKLDVDRVLRQLSEPLRVALILREMHDLSYDEISAVLRVPTGTVRSRLHEARRQFRELWREGDSL